MTAIIKYRGRRTNCPFFFLFFSFFFFPSPSCQQLIYIIIYCLFLPFWCKYLKIFCSCFCVELKWKGKNFPFKNPFRTPLIITHSFTDHYPTLNVTEIFQVKPIETPTKRNGNKQWNTKEKRKGPDQRYHKKDGI